MEKHSPVYHYRAGATSLPWFSFLFIEDGVEWQKCLSDQVINYVRPQRSLFSECHLLTLAEYTWDQTIKIESFSVPRTQVTFCHFEGFFFLLHILQKNNFYQMMIVCFCILAQICHSWLWKSVNQCTAAILWKNIQTRSSSEKCC